LMKPNSRNLFRKKLTHDRVVLIIGTRRIPSPRRSGKDYFPAFAFISRLRLLNPRERSKAATA
jgi:hypothetical protein